MVMSTKMRMARHVARMFMNRDAYRLLVGKTKGRSPIGRPRCRSVGNIKMGFGEIEWCGMDWVDLVQGRNQSTVPLSTVMYLWVP
jgi:hypothetical protein